ncbi:MAG: hypothetical protein GVY24_05765 [Planctomycetes bacterium]|jgi:tetratricopeptide (TPR) repeat protein|nr:hypothetical protein [Planctomycetota bacterium]
MYAPDRIPRLARRGLTVALALLLSWLCAATAEADAVKLSGFWIENVTVHNIKDGQIRYLSPAGSNIEADLSSLEGLKLDAYPQLGEGLEAAEAGEIDQAIETLRKVQRDAKEPWLKRFLEWKLYDLYNTKGDGPEAVKHYLDLVNANAHGAYLDNPPINAAAMVPPDQAQAIVERLRAAQAQTEDALVKEHLATLIELIQVPTAPDAGSADGEGPTDPQPGQPTVVAAGGIILPSNPPESPTVALLKQGQLSKALASAKRDVRVVGGLSEKLFYLGLIERAIADAAEPESEDRNDLYKDAGLTFMRVVIHYPKSRYAPLALLEVGYVHEQIGQAEQARSLYAEAANAITPEDYPDYHTRLLELTGGGEEAPAP